MKILLDTDIGCDIDDCFALAYLLSKNNAELLGITTTTGNSHLRAQLAHEICEKAGRNVPIHVGFEKALNGECLQPIITWNELEVAQNSDKKYENQCTAIEFLKETIEANPNEITLIAIGPLTNVAVLFERYPHVLNLLKGMVIMGGRFEDNANFDYKAWGKTEWNILCDPKAAEIVFSKNVKPTVVVGIEQTVRFFAVAKKLREGFLKTERFSQIGVAIGECEKYAWFHDAVAIYSFLNKSQVALTRGNVTVETKEDCVKTVFTQNEKGNYELVTDFSLKAFRNEYVKTVGIADDSFELN